MVAALFFRKNLPMWERVCRVIVGAGVALAAFSVWPASTWQSWLVAACGLSFIYMGFIGFCPVCAMAGRSPVDRYMR